ncbi:MAG: T9SS type A sorting domain-containing protein [candidate division WOR-3 bacterium]
MCLSVYDPVGKLVKRLTFEPATNKILDLDLRPGVYFLEMRTGSYRLHLKVLI